MLPADALEALDQLHPREALSRPLTTETTARRTARLLAGNDAGDTSLTVGDALFRWARVEPEALADADLAELNRMSEIIGSIGRIPKRFGLQGEAVRSAAGLAAAAIQNTGFDDNGLVAGTARSYLLQRLLAHLFDAQGCEAVICGAEDDPTAILLNGLPARGHDPASGPPTDSIG